MNKLKKVAVIVLVIVSSGVSLTACSNNDTKQAAHKLFVPKEPSYDESLTLEKIQKSVVGDPQTNETTDLTDKIFKIKVDHIGKSDAGIKGIVPLDTIKNEDGENIFSIIPNDQNIKDIKAGDTVYLKITEQNTFAGLVILNVDIVK